MTAFNQLAAAAQETTETVRTTTAAPGCDEVIQPPTLPSRYGAILLLLLSVVFRLCSIYDNGDVRCHFCRDMTHVNVIIITVTPPPKSLATQCLLSFPLPFCNYSYYALASNDLKNGFELKENGLKGFFRFLFMSPM